MLKERYVNPFTDFGFKKLFGSEPNKDLLVDFLNTLLDGQEVIASLTYSKNEHQGRNELDRKAIFDLYCENERGEKFIVEIQKAKQKFFKDRSLYYSTFPITEQAEVGDWSFQLKSVYTIAILDFVFDDDDRDKTVVTNVQLMDTKKHTVFYDKLTFIYLQMPNFNKQEEELQTHFDKWLYVFKNLPKLHDRPHKLQERVFEKLFSIAEIAKFTRDETMDYEESLMVYRDLKNTLDTAREEALEEGRTEGRVEEKEGVARKAIPNGLSNELIQAITGLPLDVIEMIRREIEGTTN